MAADTSVAVDPAETNIAAPSIAVSESSLVVEEPTNGIEKLTENPPKSTEIGTIEVAVHNTVLTDMPTTEGVTSLSAKSDSAAQEDVIAPATIGGPAPEVTSHSKSEVITKENDAVAPTKSELVAEEVIHSASPLPSSISANSSVSSAPAEGRPSSKKGSSRPSSRGDEPVRPSSRGDEPVRPSSRGATGNARPTSRGSVLDSSQSRTGTRRSTMTSSFLAMPTVTASCVTHAEPLKASSALPLPRRQPGVSILDRFISLRAETSKSIVKSKQFQPDESQQRELICRNIAARLIESSLKKESVKFFFRHRIESQRIAYEEENNEETSQLETGSLHSDHTRRMRSMIYPSRNSRLSNITIGASSSKSHMNIMRRMRGYSMSSVGDEGDLDDDAFSVQSGKSPRLNGTVDDNKPLHGGGPGYSSRLAAILRGEQIPSTLLSVPEGNVGSPNNVDRLSSLLHELQEQARRQLFGAKRVFEGIIRGYDMGATVAFHPHHLNEDVDLSVYSQNTGISASAILSSGLQSNSFDYQSLLKKEGLLLIVDPTLSTGGQSVRIKITYMRQIDLNREEEVVREYIFQGDGNYYGKRIIKPVNSVYAHIGSTQETLTESNTNPSSRRTSEMITPDVVAIGPDGHRLCAAQLSAALQTVNEGANLPGWQNCPPIFIPALRCRVELIGLEKFKIAAVATSVSKLRLHFSVCSSPRQGLKRIHEFLRYFTLQDTVNLPLLGGISPLNYAAFHGNLDAVRQLLALGATLHPRSRQLVTTSYFSRRLGAMASSTVKDQALTSTVPTGTVYSFSGHLPLSPHIVGAGTDDHRRTALHCAVLGEKVEVASVLLENGANQLVKDHYGQLPLHYACLQNSISLVTLLCQSPNAKAALLQIDSQGHRPMDLVTSNFLKARLDVLMRKLRIFVKPRMAALDNGRK